MALPARASVPLPEIVDDWVDNERCSRGISFDALALEALRALWASLGVETSAGTPSDIDVDTWMRAQAASIGGGEADRVTEALCLLYEQRTEVNLLAIPDLAWRRLPETPRQVRQQKGAHSSRNSVPREERARRISAAWRAAGRPRDPRRRWYKALANFEIPASERFNVYVWPELIGEDLSAYEASALMRAVQQSDLYRHRSIVDFATWPVSAGPIPPNPAERDAVRLAWLRSLGFDVPSPDEDSAEQHAWQSWTSERWRLRNDLDGTS